MQTVPETNLGPAETGQPDRCDQGAIRPATADVPAAARADGDSANAAG